MKRILLWLWIAFPIFALAQEKPGNYHIDIKIKGLNDSVIYLANYYGDKTFLVDTAFRKGKNNFLFEGQKKLGGGIYIVVGQAKNSIFEFLIADSQELKFDSDMEQLIEKMKVKGSNENALFFDYLSYSNIQFKKLKQCREGLLKLSPPNDSIALLNKQIDGLNADINDYKESIIEAYPNAFITHLFKAMKSPEVSPEEVKTDSIAAFNYYKKHYWDYIDFTDDRLIRTPVFHNRVDYYFTSIAHPNPDSLWVEIDSFLHKLPENSEMYKHSLWFLTVKFDESKRIGYDALLVYFADNYYANGKAKWLNSGVIKNIIAEAKKRRNVLIGKQAPNLVMQNLNGTPVSMYNIKKDFTLLYFWDPNCGHCQIETPQLKAFYDKYAEKYNLEVYAVCADADLVEMKDYIEKNKLDWINVNGPRSYTQDFHELYNMYSTPTLFVLDKDKKIIVKQIKTEQLLKFLNLYLKQNKPTP